VIYKFSVDIVRDLLDDKKSELDDLLGLKRREGPKNFCGTIKYESAETLRRPGAHHTWDLLAVYP
jgi:hypothetical protein